MERYVHYKSVCLYVHYFSWSFVLLLTIDVHFHQQLYLKEKKKSHKTLFHESLELKLSLIRLLPTSILSFTYYHNSDFCWAPRPPTEVSLL
jgi:hypothetical protein